MKNRSQLYIIAAVLALIAAYFWLSTRDAAAADLGGNCCADLEERIAELEATTARKGNRKVSVSVYGQVNKALLLVEGDEYVVTNTTDETRVGVTGGAPIGASYKALYVIEFANFLDNDLVVRRAAIALDGRMGRVTIGKFDTAAYDINDVSVVDLTAARKGLDFFGASPFDGDIDDIVRYDTPVMSGFKLSASWAAASNQKEIALRYTDAHGDFKYAVGVAYIHAKGGELLSGSGSIQHIPSGVFVNAALAADASKVSDSVWHLTGGVDTRLNELGHTSFYVEYGELEDAFGIDGWGLGVVQKIDAAAMDAYIGYRQLDGADFVFIGSRMKF